MGKRLERVRLRLKRETISEQPFHGLEQVLIAPDGVTLSSRLSRECAARMAHIIRTTNERIEALGSELEA